MCIAMLNVAGSILPLSYFIHSAQANPHGMGLLWARNGKMMAHKQMVHPESFYEQYLTVRKENPDAPIAIHFRWATHGATNLANCHPFLITAPGAAAPWAGLVHNGMLDVGDYDKEWSDTALYCARFLSLLPEGALTDPVVRSVVEASSEGSKLIILDTLGGFEIIHDRAGHYDAQGNWFSNGSYKAPARHFQTGKKTAYQPAYQVRQPSFWQDADETWEDTQQKAPDEKANYALLRERMFWHQDAEPQCGTCRCCEATIYDEYEIDEEMCEACMWQLWAQEEERAAYATSAEAEAGREYLLAEEHLSNPFIPSSISNHES